MISRHESFLQCTEVASWKPAPQICMSNQKKDGGNKWSSEQIPVDVAIRVDSNIMEEGTWENRELPRAEETTGVDVEDKVWSGLSGNMSIKSYNA